eukprot:GFKZ01011971.1.p1 GENE.GFKZ01011971.1~~GFKZ01011971.1.p1  ORF type:complete len:254 (+),score=45.21 GFKZ01011971.1:193-954(+)
MTMWDVSQARMVELSLTLETATRRAYEFMVTSPQEAHPRGTEALKGPCAYAKRIIVGVEEQYLTLHLVQGGRSRHNVTVRMSEVLRAWREGRSMKVAVSIFTVSMFVDGYEREGASLIGRFRFVSMMIRNSWRMIGPGVEGVVYVRRADGGWKCVYRKGRCESGGEVLLYGNQAVKGAEVRVEGVATKNGEVLFGGGGVLKVEEGSGVGWWGGGGRIDRVEGKGVVEVDLQLIVEGGGWWRRRWRKEEKVGLL